MIWDIYIYNFLTKYFRKKSVKQTTVSVHFNIIFNRGFRFQNISVVHTEYYKYRTKKKNHVGSSLIIRYLRRVIVRRRRRSGRRCAAVAAVDRDDRSATTWTATGRRQHRHRCRSSKTRRRIPNTRRSPVQFGPPR